VTSHALPHSIPPVPIVVAAPRPRSLSSSAIAWVLWYTVDLGDIDRPWSTVGQGS
jgi:hypothetical protein